MAKRNRQLKTKAVIQKMSGKRIANLLPAQDKVDIMEYLLQCPASELQSYKGEDYPTFIVECATLLAGQRIGDYISLLRECRAMAEEDRKCENKENNVNLNTYAYQ